MGLAYTTLAAKAQVAAVQRQPLYTAEADTRFNLAAEAEVLDSIEQLQLQLDKLRAKRETGAGEV